MNLYLIKRSGDIDYDEAAGHVVAAGSYAEARKLAAVRAGDEGEATWVDARYSSCQLLATNAHVRKGVVLTDFRAG